MRPYTMLLACLTCYLSACDEKVKVKSTEESTYMALYRFGEVQKGDLLEKNISKYDERGNEIERTNLNQSLSPIPKESYKYSYRYDAKGNIVEKNSYDFDGCLFEKSTCKYDTKGKQIQEDTYFKASC